MFYDNVTLIIGKGASGFIEQYPPEQVILTNRERIVAKYKNGTEFDHKDAMKVHTVYLVNVSRFVTHLEDFI